MQAQRPIQEKIKTKSGDYTKNPYLQLVSLVREKLSKKQISESERNTLLADFNTSIVTQAIEAQLKLLPSTARQNFLHEAILASNSFNPQDWIILNASSHNFYLLIPHAFLQKIGSQATQVNHQLALTLGLNIDKMEQLPADNLTEYVSKNWKKLTNKDDLINDFSKIFIANADYYKENRSAMIPEWSIYMTGHGGAGSDIVGLPIATFPAVLDFFEEKVTTKLLAYFSCYAAGINTEIIYTDLKRVGAQKTYSYAIITAALTDGITASSVPLFTAMPSSGTNLFRLKMADIDWINQNLHIKFDQNFISFFEGAFSTSVPVDYAKIIEPIVPLASRSTLDTKGRTAAQIRLPGLSWFSVVDAQNRVVSIGRILVATRGNSPLNILNFFKQQRPAGSPNDLAAILLYTRNVPFVLDMQGIANSDLPKIISMIPGQAQHKLAGIIADFYIKDSPATFASDGSKRVCKTFLIDKIQSKNASGISTYSNVLIDCHISPEKIYFEQYGRLSELLSPKDKAREVKFLAANDPDAKEYQDYLKNMGSAPESPATQALEDVAGKLKRMQEEHAKKVAAGKGAEYAKVLPV